MLDSRLEQQQPNFFKTQKEQNIQLLTYPKLHKTK